MIAFEEALSRLLEAARPLGAERVALDDAAGRVLAEDVVARAAIPAFDHSAMDGYAVAAADLAGDGPFTLPVRGESAAGAGAARLEGGTACRIFTGARLPNGADAVIMQEDVTREGELIRFATRPRPQQHVRRRGEDLAEGTVALARGARLGPGAIALAAGLERAFLHVARRPIVSVLCTGDELRSPGDPARADSIPETNGFFVAAAARALGAHARVLPFVRDTREDAERAVREALRGVDVLVTIGGVSVGDHDVVRPALEAAGVALDFWRVAMKPGKPLAVGRAGATHVLGLPGNPASASLTFLMFGAPLLRALQGDVAPLPPRVPVRVRGSLRRKAGRLELARARLSIEGGELVATLAPNQASGAVTSFAWADALVVVPLERERVEDGDRLDAIRIGDVYG
jgi:molybdopterin molybdotransferase